MLSKLKILLVIAISVITVACVADKEKQSKEQNFLGMAKLFQHDADLARLSHLKYWSKLIETYKEIKGEYPFQKLISPAKDTILVKIATKQQMRYISSGYPEYNTKLDNNSNKRFKEKSIKEFVYELEKVLGKTIDEKYDIQRVPVQSPVGYYYFATKDGYLLWVTCITCGVTKISTLLFDGFTPTVNIVSEGMKGMVTKALTRKKMLTDAQFKQWISRPYSKKGFVEKVVQENKSDSKN